MRPNDERRDAAKKTCARCCPTCTQTKACSVHCMAYNHPQGACQPVPPNPFQQLAKEFRRLAAEAVENREKFRETQESYLVTFYNGMRVAYQRAGQMLEEKLNG